ncbi:integrase-type DNA-binding superfamily protein [Artemisia annua]|uniref:Integrase-type DNA-binding superfamily protein n=1 Tax=Artemisia annua TaxID=35608 RepID=A0A2U1KDC7_ARTAN|nr:integrase-type DNA-binding superfamily protein [Artemisia annua]
MDEPATSPTQLSANVPENVVMESKKKGSEKIDQKRKIVHRKSLDTCHRTSQCRGVISRHIWTRLILSQKKLQRFQLKSIVSLQLRRMG